jgi:hypothetical protein
LSAIVEPIVVWILLFSFTSATRNASLLDIVLPPIWRIRPFREFGNNVEVFDSHLTWFEEFMAISLRRRIISDVSTDLALLSSLGLLFPPLALIILFSMWKQMIEVKLALNRYDSIMDNVSDEGVRLHMLQIRCLIERELNEANRYITEGYWYGMVVATWLLAFILFDTIAPSVGAGGGIAMAVVMTSSPWWLYYSIIAMIRSNRTAPNNNEPMEQNKESLDQAIINPVVELSELSSDKP